MYEPKDNEGKYIHINDEFKSQRILIESIKYHFIPFVLELRTSKQVYDFLVGLYTTENITYKISLRYQLLYIQMPILYFVASDFTRITH